MGSRLGGLGFRGLGFRVGGLGFRVGGRGSGFRVGGGENRRQLVETVRSKIWGVCATLLLLRHLEETVSVIYGGSEGLHPKPYEPQIKP